MYFITIGVRDLYLLFIISLDSVKHIPFKVSKSAKLVLYLRSF